VAIALIRFPDTPRWYLMKGLREKGIEVLKRIEPPEQIKAQIKEIDNDLNMNEGKVRELFQKRFAKATFFVIGFGFLVQITGINAIVYYAPIIFGTIGLATSKSILVSAIIQVSSFVAEIIAFFIVDRAGRRPTLLIGVGAMAVSAAVMAVLFFQNNFEGAGIYLSFFSIMVFNMAFNFSLGSLVWVYASECYPARLRGAGSSTLLTSDLVANLIVAQLFLVALNVFGGGWTFGAFMVLSLVAWIFILMLAPETKGRSLEEIRNYWDNGGRWES
jgi:MFS family permease